MKASTLPLVLVALVLAALCLTPLRAFTWTTGMAPTPPGMFYGPHTAFFLVTPPGWIMDSQVYAPGEGAVAKYYPKGNSCRDTLVEVYADIFDKTDRVQSVQQIMLVTAAKLRSLDPELVFFRAGEAVNNQARRAPIYHYFYTENGRKVGKAVAYYDVPRSIDMVVLRAKSVDSFNAALPAFRELAGSYMYMGGNVDLP